MNYLPFLYYTFDMEQTTGYKGLQVKKRPRKYLMLHQQRRLIDASKACGIKKGISKIELMDKMKNCIPRYFKEHKECQ